MPVTPIQVAEMQALCAQHGFDLVVAFGYSREGQRVYRATFGVDAVDKVFAVQLAERCELAMSLDEEGQVYEDFRRDFDVANDEGRAALFKEAIDLLKLIVSRNGTTAPMIQQAERITKAAGRGTRAG